MKDGEIRISGGLEVATEETIRETFDTEVRIFEIDNKKIVVGGLSYEH